MGSAVTVARSPEHERRRARARSYPVRTRTRPPERITLTAAELEAMAEYDDAWMRGLVWSAPEPRGAIWLASVRGYAKERNLPIGFKAEDHGDGSRTISWAAKTHG